MFQGVGQLIFGEYLMLVIRSMKMENVPNFGAKFYFKLVIYNQISAMFESQKFLNTYLPIHFKNSFSQLMPSNSSLKNGLKAMRFVSQFLTLSHRLYLTVKQQTMFLKFLTQNFFIDSQIFQKGDPNWQIQTHAKTFMQTISSQYGQVLSSSMNLYLSIVHFDVLHRRQELPSCEKLKQVKLLASICQKIRFNFQFQKITNIFLELEFDQYIEEVLGFVLSWNFSKQTQNIIELLMSEECANFSDNTKDIIKKKILQKNLKKMGSIQNFKEQKKIPKTIDVKKILRKKNSYDKLETNSFEKQKEEFFNKSLSTTFENKSIEDEESKGSLRRISEFIKAKKTKMISKDRTIYHQRKNTYVPKKTVSFQYDFEVDCKGTRTQTSLNSEGKTEMKNIRYEKMECEDDSQESILVRSTPKRARKAHINIISQKLEFSDL